MMLAIGLLPSWLGLFGSAHWLLDLFAHFRWQYLLFAIVALAAGMLLRRRALILLAAATLLLNAALVGRLAWSSADEGEVMAEATPLRVLGLNVRTSSMAKQQVLDYLLGADADVVFLMEVDEAWLAALAPLEARYPSRFRHPRPDNFGLALYSRVATADARLLDFADGAMPSLEAKMLHQGRRFTFIGTHPVPPMGAAMAGSRDRQLAALADHAAQSSEPVLLVGDLNATPWSAGLRRLTAGQLAFGTHSPPWAPTWRALSPFAIPIDHALCTAPLVIVRRETGPDVGSDHRPVMYLVTWRARPSAD